MGHSILICLVEGFQIFDNILIIRSTVQWSFRCNLHPNGEMFSCGKYKFCRPSEHIFPSAGQFSNTGPNAERCRSLEWSRDRSHDVDRRSRGGSSNRHQSIEESRSGRDHGYRECPVDRETSWSTHDRMTSRDELASLGRTHHHIRWCTGVTGEKSYVETSRHCSNS